MIFKLQGTYQHYAWGGDKFIPHWQNFAIADNKPYAEYWLGAHRTSPSLVEFNKNVLPLDQLLDKEPELLGHKSFEKFGAELPYLLKILDVKLPLSIQLHPTKQQAEIGFEQENQLGIALNAPNRTYKDSNHKPEMMIALSDFWLLHGFKTKEKIIVNLARYPSLQPLAEIVENQGIEPLYQHIMQASQSELEKWLLPIIQLRQADFGAEKIAMSDPDYWLLYTMQAMEIPKEKLDAGLLCFYLFNIVQVKKGEGIYQGAGLPHAYLRGQCIELMAASDNVIRGGLTPKYIDIPALLSTVDYQEVIPQLISQAKICEQSPLYAYPTPKARDFALQHFTIYAFEESRLNVENATILLIMEGALHLKLNSDYLSLKQGESAFISAGSLVEIIGDESGYAVIASIP